MASRRRKHGEATYKQKLEKAAGEDEAIHGEEV